MSNASKPAPTEEEVRAAKDLLMRHAAAQAQAERDALKPVVELAGTEEFRKVHEALFAIDASFLAHAQLGPHLMAARTGLNGLAAAAERFEPTPEPAE